MVNSTPQPAEPLGLLEELTTTKVYDKEIGVDPSKFVSI